MYFKILLDFILISVYKYYVFGIGRKMTKRGIVLVLTLKRKRKHL